MNKIQKARAWAAELRKGHMNKTKDRSAGYAEAYADLLEKTAAIDQPQPVVSQTGVGEGVSVNIFGLIAAIKQIPVRREPMSGQTLSYVQRDEVIGAIEDFAARHARGVPYGLSADLAWIIKHCDAPEKAARSRYRGMEAIKHVAENAFRKLAAQPTKDAG